MMMRRNLARAAAAGGFLFILAGLAGAGCSHPLKLAVDPGGYHVRGDYVGSQRHVKLFVEGLHAEPMRAGRGSGIVVNLALLNERAVDARFMTGENKLDIDDQSYSPVESHVVNLRAGQLARVSITYKTKIAASDLGGGVLHVNGVEPEAGQAASFTVPFSAIDED